MKQVTAPVVNLTAPFENASCLRVEAPQIASESRPGQFVTVRCGEETLLRRPFSIHRVNDEIIEILFTEVGPGTHWLASRNPGEELDILGPLGNGFSINPNSQNLLLVAGGIGIAPTVYLAERAVAKGLSVKLLIGAKTRSQLYSESIENAEIIQTTEDGSAGNKGMITDVIPSSSKWADQIFACGPLAMYRSMAQMADQFGGRSVQILMEQVMACGIGACRGCAITTTTGIQMVCSDGPVFELNRVMCQK